MRETKGSLIQSSFVLLGYRGQRAIPMQYKLYKSLSSLPLCLSFSGLTLFIGQFIQIPKTRPDAPDGINHTDFYV